MAVHVSKGNRKIGNTGNISLPPIITCVPGVPCQKSCYAVPCYLYPEVRQQWTENLEAYKRDGVWYFWCIAEAIWKEGYEFFRWHIGGDIPDDWYLLMMRMTAIRCPDTQFMAFTKRYDYNYRNLPDNLSIVLSMWPGYQDPDHLNLPRFWVQDGTEWRVPKNAFQCPGHCEECRKCWSLKPGDHVAIDKHGRWAGNPGNGLLPLEFETQVMGEWVSDPGTETPGRSQR